MTFDPLGKILGRSLIRDKYSHNVIQPITGGIYHGNIEKETKRNPDYRNTLFTGHHSQVIVMSLLPGQEIGNEVHPKVDQFFRIEQGTAKFVLDNGKKTFTEGNGGAVMVPAGHWHNVINPSKTSLLKLYTIYSPRNHPPKTKQKLRPRND